MRAQSILRGPQTREFHTLLVALGFGLSDMFIGRVPFLIEVHCQVSARGGRLKC